MPPDPSRNSLAVVLGLAGLLVACTGRRSTGPVYEPGLDGLFNPDESTS